LTSGKGTVIYISALLVWSSKVESYKSYKRMCVRVCVCLCVCAARVCFSVPYARP